MTRIFTRRHSLDCRENDSFPKSATLNLETCAVSCRQGRVLCRSCLPPKGRRLLYTIPSDQPSGKRLSSNNSSKQIRFCFIASHIHVLFDTCRRMCNTRRIACVSVTFRLLWRTYSSFLPYPLTNKILSRCYQFLLLSLINREYNRHKWKHSLRLLLRNG